MSVSSMGRSIFLFQFVDGMPRPQHTHLFCKCFLERA
ncbi:unnamed protein product [Chondrus crispus]|uniref:Uncharacterized protein n=1 Tax=Chondrus crispus TaxID=2769 RepID=R7QG55_CHOCR|nr:unnamed protein product [Chondrus crispus]CDF36763.1 unnamed protein product [Chondrus crispus]|eukprot:XP_005716582.1 unnamed protein product [Chondrus crispus]